MTAGMHFDNCSMFLHAYYNSGVSLSPACRCALAAAGGRIGIRIKAGPASARSAQSALPAGPAATPRDAHACLRGRGPGRKRSSRRTLRRRDAYGCRRSEKGVLEVLGESRILRHAVHARTHIDVGMRLKGDCNEPVALQGQKNKIWIIVLCVCGRACMRACVHSQHVSCLCRQ